MFLLTRRTKASDVTGKIHTPGEIVRLSREGGITTARCNSRNAAKILVQRHGFEIRESDHEEEPRRGAQARATRRAAPHSERGAAPSSPGSPRGDARSPDGGGASQEAPGATGGGDGPAGDGAPADAEGGGDRAWVVLQGGIRELKQELDAGIHDARLDEMFEGERSGKARKTALLLIGARKKLVAGEG
jgi:hypothetical protein